MSLTTAESPSGSSRWWFLHTTHYPHSSSQTNQHSQCWLPTLWLKQVVILAQRHKLLGRHEGALVDQVHLIHADAGFAVVQERGSQLLQPGNATCVTQADAVQYSTSTSTVQDSSTGRQLAAPALGSEEQYSTGSVKCSVPYTSCTDTCRTTSMQATRQTTNSRLQRPKYKGTG
jgi:hypothetical protein